MKKIIAVVLIALSAQANAAMWTLVNSDYIDGSFFCTYRYLNYQTTVIMKNVCPQYIER